MKTLKATLSWLADDTGVPRWLVLFIVAPVAIKVVRWLLAFIGLA